MNNFCTLFDSHYLSRGLVMYHSLVRHSASFHLYIYPFDDIARDILVKMNLPHVTIVPMKDFEDEGLLRVKPTRTKGEYCWTCTSSIIYHAIKTFNLDCCTYLDADLYFFHDPSVLLEEMAGDSVLITEHRYSPKYNHGDINGIYCVQFVAFKNDERGMKALTWWRDRCIEWCYNRFEDGKFGDQKYLDDWTTRFEGVHVLRHLGGGVAPWNVQQYIISRSDPGYFLRKSEEEQPTPLVFFHFHWVRFMPGDKVDLGNYDLDFPCVYEIYRTWIKELIKVEREVEVKFHFKDKIKRQGILKEAKAAFDRVKRKMDGTYLVVDVKTLEK